MAKVYIIDPNADTVISLTEPLTNFAVWGSPDTEILDAQDSVSLPSPPAEDSCTEGSVVEPIEPDDSIHETIEYHVSSSILKLASSHFEQMLSGKTWKEGTPNEEDGRYHIPATEWDEEAFLILLNVLHLRNREIPRSLSLDMLAKIALLIEYYNCAEAVELWSEIWIRDLRRSTPIPSVLSREFMLWMYITWAFRLPEDFTHTTAVAIELSEHNDLSISHLPIRRFVDKISEARIDAIDTLISKLHNLLDEYRSNDYRCSQRTYSFECGSIHYGALTKRMDSLSLLSPCPEAPFPAISVKKLCTNLHSMNSPMWYTTNAKGSMRHSCSLTEKLRAIADEVQGTIKGLELADFARM